MAADGFETKRLIAPPPASRPTTPAPASTAPLAQREDWAQQFVWWFLAQTGGDPDIEGVPAGHRWRLEYFDCVEDPQAFEQYAEAEIKAYSEKEEGNV